MCCLSQLWFISDAVVVDLCALWASKPKQTRTEDWQQSVRCGDHTTPQDDAVVVEFFTKVRDLLWCVMVVGDVQLLKQ